MDISDLINLEYIEMDQEKMDAIDKKYALQSNSIEVTKKKTIEKLQLYKQWMKNLHQAGDETDNRLDKMKDTFESSKRRLEHCRQGLRKIEDALENMRAAMRKNDSGISESLGMDEEQQEEEEEDVIEVNHIINNPYILFFTRRSNEISETIDTFSRYLDGLSEEITQLQQAKTDITTQFTELQQKYDHFLDEALQELHAIE